MRHVVCISGKDSLAAALVLLDASPDLPFEFVWNDTGWEMPEVHDWMRRLEAVFGPITRVGDDLSELVIEQGILPSHRRRWCTRLAKIEPLRDYLGSSDATIYFGLRADEATRVAGMFPGRNRIYAFPLVTAGVDLAGVRRIVDSSGVAPPDYFWPWMFDRVEQLGGSCPEEMEACEYRSLFAGRSRSSCYCCFFQRMYEWVWLLETHPELFAAAERMENEHARLSEWKLIRCGFPLGRVRDRARAIKERRARDVARYLASFRQGLLFAASPVEEMESSGCGVFCGK